MLDVKALGQTFPPKGFQQGAVLAQKGGIGGCLFIVLAGEVALYHNYLQPGQRLLSVVKPGSFFGEATLFLGEPQSVTAVANTQCAVVEITYFNIFEFFSKQPEAVFALIQELCARAHPPTDHSALSVAAAAAPALQTALTVSAPAPLPVPAKPAAQTAPKTAASVPGKASDDAHQPRCTGHLILPDGHGTYTLPLDNENKEYLFDKDFTCPMCAKKFKSIAVKNFKLVTASTDPDMRIHYKGVEPMHYSIITCPDCLYSASDETFAAGAKTKLFQATPLGEMKPYLNLKLGHDRDSYTVFASYYLALTCAPLCFPRHQLVTAGLWLKLSRLYADCQDEAMRTMAAQKTFETYMLAYEKLDISPTQAPPLNNIIAETAFQLGDFKTARNFFFKLKTDKSAPRVLKDHADDRITEMRALDGGE